MCVCVCVCVCGTQGDRVLCINYRELVPPLNWLDVDPPGAGKSAWNAEGRRLLWKDHIEGLWKQVLLYIYIHVCVCVCITYVHKHTHTVFYGKITSKACGNGCVYICVCIHARTHARTNIHTHTHTHTRCSMERSRRMLVETGNRERHELQPITL